MFRIPNFYQETPTFQEAWNTMTRHGRGDCLEGMQSMNRIWEEHCASDAECDGEFFENWMYEVNAYNVVYEGMGQLFGEAA